MPATFTAIDLSRLPAPDVVEPLSYEAIYAQMLAKVREYLPDFDDSIESDPAVVVLQVAAWFRLLDRQRINDAARAVMLASATGADLDQLGALVSVQRLVLVEANAEEGTPAVLESDDAFRRRITLAPEGFSVAGPRGAYIFHALSADPDVLDADADSPDPAEVVVTVLSRTGDGEASPALLASVAAALSDEDVRPLGDRLTVQSAEIIDYAIEATITPYAGPDAAIVLAEAQARIDRFVEENRRIGRDVRRAGINAALFPAGVHNVAIASPAADIVIGAGQAAHCTGITLALAAPSE